MPVSLSTLTNSIASTSTTGEAAASRNFSTNGGSAKGNGWGKQQPRKAPTAIKLFKPTGEKGGRSKTVTLAFQWASLNAEKTELISYHCFCGHSLGSSFTVNEFGKNRERVLRCPKGYCNFNFYGDETAESLANLLQQGKNCMKIHVCDGCGVSMINGRVPRNLSTKEIELTCSAAYHQERALPITDSSVFCSEDANDIYLLSPEEQGVLSSINRGPVWLLQQTKNPTERCLFTDGFLESMQEHLAIQQPTIQPGATKAALKAMPLAKARRQLEKTSKAPIAKKTPAAKAQKPAQKKKAEKVAANLLAEAIVNNASASEDEEDGDNNDEADMADDAATEAATASEME